MINTKNFHFNPWHHVSAGKELPNVVNAIIEIPKGSQAKYELDKTSGLLKLDRVLFSSVFYPANYGFIPRTLSDDGDPLDILVICSVDVDPLCIIEAKVIGVMEMVDNMEKDEKIVAVAKNVVVEKIVGKEEAFKIVNESVERYNKAFITED